MDLSDDDELLLLLLSLAKKQTRTKRREWVSEFLQARPQMGEFQVLLESDEDKFFRHYRMSRQSFEDLHKLLKDEISVITTNYRTSITSKERLAVCLRYLALGGSQKHIADSYRIGRSTVSGIVSQVCEKIWQVLQPIYMAVPSREEWENTSMEFQARWGFPNCVGAIEGKHVHLRRPIDESKVCSYKGFNSLVCLTVVDPMYRFLIVDVGSYGVNGENDILQESNFIEHYCDNLEYPPPSTLPDSDIISPYVFLGNESFTLKTFLMRPYPKTVCLDRIDRKEFNAHLSQARTVVDRAFGILTSNWKVFSKPIDCKPEIADAIVKATCCLHNFLLEQNSRLTSVDRKREVQTYRYEADKKNEALKPIGKTNIRSSRDALEVRDRFAEYFKLQQTT
uniref:DDE Tnp4 domain-containing protein n=1 Tax=Anopheles darlingi TaxID=43151 RepID=A0A2M4CSQ9_ANODA